MTVGPSLGYAKDSKSCDILLNSACAASCLSLYITVTRRKFFFEILSKVTVVTAMSQGVMLEKIDSLAYDLFQILHHTHAYCFIKNIHNMMLIII